LQCWHGRTDLPPIDIYSINKDIQDYYNEIFGQGAVQSNVNIKTTDIDGVAFGKLLAEASFIMCPSIMEGYGHYINQARAAGALVLTTDGHPMNELVDEESGILVAASIVAHGGNQLLGPDFKGVNGLHDADYLEYDVTSKNLCEAVDRIVSELTVKDREKRASNSRKRYFEDLKFFKTKMNELSIMMRNDE